MPAKGILRLGVFFFAAAACAIACKPGGTRAEPTPVPTPSPAPTPIPVTPQASALPVTADPVAVSQRNAERRRQHRITPGEDSAAASAKVGAPRYETREPAKEHEVPEGSILRVAFDRTISSATAKTGDSVRGELLDDLQADDGVLVAPSGSRVSAKVEQATPSGALGGQAELVFRLVELTPAGGRTIPVSTSAFEHKGESHTKHDATYIAGGAAVGALLGQLLGRDTRSTLIGSAAGAAAGTGVAAATGKLDVQIEAGRTVAFTLEQPLRLPASR